MLKLLALLQAASTSSTEVRLFVPSWVSVLYGQLLTEFGQLNSTVAAHPNTTFSVQSLQDDTAAALENIQLLNRHPDPRVRSSLDLFYVDIVYAPDVAEYCTDLTGVMPGGPSWFERAGGSPKIVGSYISAFTVGDKLVALPDYVQTGVFFYRKDLMRRYGLCDCVSPRCRSLPASRQECDPPDTWDEMERMAKIIQDGERRRHSDFWGFLIEGKASEGLTCRILEIFSSHADPSNPAMSGLDIDPIVLQSRDVVVNRNHTINALRRMSSWLGRITPLIVRDWGAGATRDMFRDGNGAFMINWLSMTSGLECETCATRGKIGVWRIPGVVPGLGRGTAGGFAYGLSPHSDDRRAAVDLMTYLVEPHAHIVKHLSRGQVPAVVDLINENRPAEICNRTCPTCAVPCDVDLTGTYVVARPSRALRPYYSEASSLLSSKTAEVLSGRLEPEKAALGMECGIIELLHGANAQPARCKIKNDCGLGKSRIGEQCSECPVGKFADLFTVFCVDCSTGFAAPLPGSSACEGCPPGTIADAVGAANCTECGRGSFQRMFAQSRCAPCEPGFYQAEDGQTSCAACPTGKYQDRAGEDACVDCSPDRSTLGRGANRPGECVCLQGTYLSESSQSCTPCQEGLVCPGGQAAPTTEDGYFADVRARLPPEAFEGVAAEFSVFECAHNKQACPAGPVGQCAHGRQGVQCFDCKPGLAPQGDGTCRECSDGDKALFAGFFVGLLIGTSAVYYNTDRYEHNLPTHSALLPVAAGSMCVTSVQQLGIIGTTSVMFVAPLRQMLVIPMSLVQLDFLSVDCVATLASVPAYAIRSCGILIVMTLAALVHALFVVARHKAEFRSRMHRLIFVEGTLMMVFMISSVNTSIAPFQCEPHPNGLRTVRAYGTVICYGSEDHIVMVCLGLCFLLIPIGFLACCAYAVYQFPARIRAGDLKFMEASGFLFSRFKPECYWYVIIFVSRNFIIALAPTLPTAPVQVMTIAVVSLGWVLLITRLAPWRSPIANLLDLIVSGFTMNFVYMSAFFINTNDTSGIAVFCSVVVGLIIFLPLCFLAYAAVLLVILRNWKPFKFFICHHKGGAGAFARYMKLMLLSAMRGQNRVTSTEAALTQRQSFWRMTTMTTTSSSSSSKRKHPLGPLAKLFARQDVFLDCDNLMTLDSLFDAVASSVETLVLIQSKSLLLRPWCMGEIATAYSKKVQVFRLSMPDFSEPDDDFIAHYEEFVDISCLGPFGINMKRIAHTLRWLRKLDYRCAPSNLTASTMQDLVQDIMNIKTRHFSLMMQSMSLTSCLTESNELKAFANTDVFIVVDQSDKEAVASGLALAQMLKQVMLGRGMSTTDVLLRLAMPMVLPAGTALPDHASVVIFACSAMAFHRLEFLEVLIEAAVRRATVMPVVVQDGFRFPTTPEAQEELTRVVNASPALLNVVGGPEVLIRIIENLFKEIAVTFSPQFSGSSRELMMKAEDVARRVLAEGTTRLEDPTDGLITIHRRTL